MSFDCSGFKAYSGYYRDTQKLLQSASGGAANVISEAIIKNGGVVFGACYSPDFRTAEFACVESLEDLGRLKGSKYIPTLKRVLLDGEYVPLWLLVAEKLKEGREILFTGLDCDVAALKSYLKANHVDSSRLYTVDLICYGPTLTEIHRQYVESLEKKYHSRLKSFSVRHKAKGWTPYHIRAEFEDGREFVTRFYNTDYGEAFGIGYSRETCYKCKFKGMNHQADITVGDFWGMQPEMEGWNPNGVSIFFVRTPKGEELMSRIDPKEFALRPADANFAAEHNVMFYTSRNKPKDYRKFCDDLVSYGLHKAVVNHYGGTVKYFAFRVKKLLRKIFFIGKQLAKKVTPAPIWQMLKKILRRK